MREPKDAPKLVIDENIHEFYEFKSDSLRLEGYKPHKFDTKIPVAI